MKNEHSSTKYEGWVVVIICFSAPPFSTPYLKCGRVLLFVVVVIYTNFKILVILVLKK